MFIILATDLELKSSPQRSNSWLSLLKSDVFKLAPKQQNIWASLVSKCVTKAFRNFPNLVILVWTLADNQIN